MHDVIDRSTRFFIQVPNDLVTNIKNANALYVYAILKTFTNKDTNLVFPSRETIAKIMGAKTTKPVDTALRELQKLGLVATFPRWLGNDGTISRTKTGTHSRQTSNGYILYDTINRLPPEGWDNPDTHLPKSGGVGSQKGTRGGSQKGTPRVAEMVHEVYPLEVHPSEVEKLSSIDIEPGSFDEFYTAYPRKGDKRKAEEKWGVAILDTDPSTIIEAAKKYREEKTGVSRNYVKLPSTWLNQRCWEDYADVSVIDEILGKEPFDDGRF